MYSVCILIYVSIKQPINIRDIWTVCRWSLRAIRGVPGNHDAVNSAIHSKPVIERVWGYTWRMWSCELGGHNRARLETHPQGVIEWVWRYSWWTTLSESGDALGDRDHANSKSLIMGVWRSTWRVYLREFGDTLGGDDWVNWEMHSEIVMKQVGDALGGRHRGNLQAIIEQVWRYTCRPWSSEFGDSLGGCDWAKLDEYLEAVDGQCARCWDSIHQLVHEQPWECDKVTFPLSSDGDLGNGSRWCRVACRKLKLNSEGNSYSWEWREHKSSCLDGVRGVCYTQYQLMIMAWRDWAGWLNFVFCDNSRVVDEKESYDVDDENDV